MIVSSLPCPDDTATVVLYISPSPIVNISGTSNTICYGENDTLTVQSSGNYLWTPSGSTNPTIVVSPSVTTTYYLTVTNSNLCSTTDSVLVTVNPPGIPDAGNDQLICRGDSATFFGTQAGGGGYRWSSLGDGTFIPNVLNQQVTYVPGVQDTANGFARIVLATTGYCLNLTDTLFLLVNDLPTINAGTDTTSYFRSRAQASPFHYHLPYKIQQEYFGQHPEPVLSAQATLHLTHNIFHRIMTLNLIPSSSLPLQQEHVDQ